jgi:integrase
MYVFVFQNIFYLPNICPMKKKLTIKSVAALSEKSKYYDVWDTEIPGFFLRVQPTGNKSYYLFYRNEKGEKRTYTIGKGLTAVQARDIAQTRYGEVSTGVDICQREKMVKQEAKKAKATTVLSFLQTVYKPWLLENRRSGLNAYNRINHSFASLHDKQLEGLTAWDLELWRKARKATGVSDSTLKKDLAELKAMFARAREWHFIKVNPIYDFKYGKVEENRIDRYLTDTERERLCRALDEREGALRDKRTRGNKWRDERGYELLTEYGSQNFVDYLKPMVILALNTGMRRGELFRLEWSDVNLSKRQLLVVSTSAKSKKLRYIPLNTEAQDALGLWKKQSSDANRLVFSGKNRHRLTDIKKSWGRALTSAKIENFRFHDMRHDFASQLVMKGVDLYVVKELLGHSSIQVTERYAHLAPKQLEDAVNLLNA